MSQKNEVVDGVPAPVAASHDGGWKPWVGLVARLGLAAVWIFAAWSKFDLAHTTLSVRNYRVAWPDGINVLIGHTLPFLEMGVGILILLGLFTRFAAGVSSVMLVLFMIAIAWAWNQGLTLDCGCFGKGGQVGANETTYPQDIMRDIGFLILALWLVRFPRTRLSADRGLGLVAP